MKAFFFHSASRAVSGCGLFFLCESGPSTVQLLLFDLSLRALVTFGYNCSTEFVSQKEHLDVSS